MPAQQGEMLPEAECVCETEESSEETFTSEEALAAEDENEGEAAGEDPGQDKTAAENPAAEQNTDRTEEQPDAENTDSDDDPNKETA